VTPVCVIEALPAVNAPKGAYIWGGPGCGKSFTMDLFYKCVAPQCGVKRRVHFNEFMLDVHQRLHRLNTGTGCNPVSTPFQPHFNHISTPFQLQFNPILTTFRPE